MLCGGHRGEWTGSAGRAEGRTPDCVHGCAQAWALTFWGCRDEKPEGYFSSEQGRGHSNSGLLQVSTSSPLELRERSCSPQVCKVRADSSGKLNQVADQRAADGILIVATSGHVVLLVSELSLGPQTWWLIISKLCSPSLNPKTCPYEDSDPWTQQGTWRGASAQSKIQL